MPAPDGLGSLMGNGTEGRFGYFRYIFREIYPDGTCLVGPTLANSELTISVLANIDPTKLAIKA